MPVQDSQAVSEDLPVEETEVEEQAPAEGSSPEQPQKEETFTRAQVEAMLADFEEKKVKPLIQSQVAKSENRTSQRISERFAALEENKAALNLTDEQVTAAKDNIIREEQMREFEPKSPQGGETQEPASVAEDFNRFVDSQIDAVFAAHEVRVTPDMPEYKMIEEAWNNPKGSLAETLMAANKAAETAAGRLKALKGKATARTFGGGGSETGEPKPKTAEEKISRGLKTTQWSTSTPQK